MRRSMPIVSRTNQWSLCASSVASTASTASRRPRSSGPGADVELVGAQRSGSRRRARAPSRAATRSRPPRRSRRRPSAARRSGALHGERRGARARGRSRRRRARSAAASSSIGALERRQRDALRVGAAGRSSRRARARARCTARRELLPAWRSSSTSRHSLRALAAHAFGGGAEDVGEVAAHLALVGQRASARRCRAARRAAAPRAGSPRASGRRPARSRRRRAPARSRRRRSAPLHGGEELQAGVTADESSRPLRVSLVNLQKFTFQAWLDVPSMKMLAPEQNTRSLARSSPRPCAPRDARSGCGCSASCSSMSTPRS